MLERVSPRVIVLDPPEKLVIETRASGGYRQFDWTRNGNPFTTAPGQPFSITLQEFSNFFEIFVREPTTANDLGVYETDLVLNAGPQVPELQFFVTPYSKYIYTKPCVCVFFCVFFSHTCNLHFIQKIVLCPAIHIPPGGVDDWAQDYTASTYTDYL